MNKYIGSGFESQYGVDVVVDLTKIKELIAEGKLKPTINEYKGKKSQVINATFNPLREPRGKKTHALAVSDYYHPEIEGDVAVNDDELAFY